ncbi:MAG: hypothetical protein GF399_04735 [Candidatus Coatesbacteria bacterium]|nr:hypothetical protein [Candidatus Coatesbacteria bacterium]
MDPHEYYYVEVKMKDGEVCRAMAIGDTAAWICPYCHQLMMGRLSPDPKQRPTRAQKCCSRRYLIHGAPGNGDHIRSIEEF